MYNKISAIIKGFLIGLLSSFLAICAFAQTSILPQQTIINLNKAYKDELTGAKQYELSAKKAEEENLKQVAKLFKALSKSESVHENNHKNALVNLKSAPNEIEFGEIKVDTTSENLEYGLKDKIFEYEYMYPKYLKQAQIDNVRDAVKSFLYARKSEKQHEKLIRKAIRELGRNKPEDYCVSSITGATYAVGLNTGCPTGFNQNEKEYIRIE